MVSKYKKSIGLILLLMVVMGGIYIMSTHRGKDDIDSNYKPMVKVNDKIYYWSKDLEDIDLTDFTLIGEVEKSDNSLSKSLDEEDENFSSNIYPIRSKIYTYDDLSILVEFNSDISLCVEEE